MFADIVYFTSLITCIFLGGYYKQIRDNDTKRNYGTGLGILIAYLICGANIYHSILITWGNIIIIKCCDKLYLHQLSLSYTWTYLTYMHIALYFENQPYVLWVHQAISLRLVGLAFEIHMTEKKKSEFESKPHTSKNDINVPEMDVPEEPSAVDIIAYTYYFIGIHKGPYYRWKMFQDHFKTPFGVLGDCRVITEQKLKKAAAYTLLFMVLRTNFPIQIYYDKKFYTEYGADSRYLYNIPHLVMFYLQSHIIMMLCSSVCAETGFGIYPSKCQPKSGHGPTARFSLLKLAASDNEVALEQDYNFAALRSFEFDKIVFGPKMRDTLKAWDMTTRYWFATHAYKNICKCKKELRKMLVYLVWIIFNGPTLQNIITTSTLWVHTSLEFEYAALEETNLSMQVPWDVGFSITRLLCLIYLTPCFIIPDTEMALQYYNSIMWVYHLLLIVLIITAFALYKTNTVRRIAN